MRSRGRGHRHGYAPHELVARIGPVLPAKELREGHVFDRRFGHPLPLPAIYGDFPADLRAGPGPLFGRIGGVEWYRCAEVLKPARLVPPQPRVGAAAGEQLRMGTLL